MEHLPHRSPDEEPRGPKDERLHPAEIDMTGVIPQDDVLADVIGDAIGEAEAGNGEVPEWGARTLARALANERDDPLSGALHHFAVTGRVDPEAMAQELADLYQRATDEQIREWVNWLGTYVIRLPDRTEPTSEATDHDDDVPDLGRSPDEFSARMHHAFAEADARGEPITNKNARAVATLFAIYLDPNSAMASFADTGDADPVLLHRECQFLRRVAEHTLGMALWIDHLERHLASRTDLGRQAEPPADSPDTRDEGQSPSAAPARADEIPIAGTPLEQVTAYLRIAFNQADARGEPISRDDAILIATLLADLLGPASEIRRFSETGDANPALIHEECQRVQADHGATPAIRSWVERFEQYLAAETTLGRQGTSLATPAEADTTPDGLQVLQGISQHGDAFRAYLQLPDVRADSDDLLQRFHDAYLGSVGSVKELLAHIHDVMTRPADKANIDLGAMSEAALERSAHLAWDIVEIGGRFHLFSK
jgi:hypothetical protein